MSVFVVMGKCGEYSDRREWIVGYADTAEEAAAHVRRLAEVYAAAKLIYDDEDNYDEKAWAPLLKLDARFTSDYTGTTYSVVTVDPIGELSA